MAPRRQWTQHNIDQGTQRAGAANVFDAAQRFNDFSVYNADSMASINHRRIGFGNRRARISNLYDWLG
jgi:hypothetical protein